MKTQKSTHPLNAIPKLSVLSPFYSLPKIDEILKYNPDEERQEVQLLRENNLHILQNTEGKIYLINSTIKTFLESFSKPRSLSSVITEFAKMSDSQPWQIEKVMHSFYRNMNDEGIIIPNEIAENIKALMTEEKIEQAHYGIGDQIGDYEVIEELNIRGASQLYLVRHIDFKDPLVIKTMIYPELLPDEVRNRSVRKFRQEFKLMEALGSHTNVCKLIEFNEEGRNPFAVIEHVEGCSLRSYVKNNDLTIDQKNALINDVLSSIAHVQSKRVVHGDIHLSNFLVNTSGLIKLIDFGLSNNVTLEKGEIRRNGAVYECVPPERVVVNPFSFLAKRADFRSEVFQLGVIIFYILYHDYPFKGFTWAELAEEIREKQLDFSSFTSNGDSISSRLIQMLQKSLKKDPAERFNDAAEMLRFYRSETPIQ